MTRYDKFFQTIDNQLVDETDLSVLVDDIHPGAPLVIAFGFYSFDKTPAFDFYGRLKKLQKLTGQKLNLILLRDKTNSWYQRGIDGLGKNIAETITALKEIIDKISPSEIITIGQSMGAYGAIHYGALLNADKVISFGPLSFLDTKHAQKIMDNRWIVVMQSLEKNPPDGFVSDLAQLLANRKPLPEIDVIFGSMKEDIAPNLDSYHAARLNVRQDDDNPVILTEFKDSPHAIVKYLIDNKLIDNILCKIILNENLSSFDYNEVEENNVTNNMPIKLSAAWNNWILENISLGVPKDAIKEALLQDLSELTPAEAESVIEHALNNNHDTKEVQTFDDLRKRDWLITILDDMYRRKDKYTKNFERNDLPSFQTFLDEYSFENKPALFRGAVKNWPAMQWTPQNLKEKVGNPIIEVQADRSKDERFEENGHKYKTKMNFHDFIDKVLSLDSSNDLYLTANNGSASNASLAPMFKDIANIGDGYMDMSRVNGNGFIWIGPKGTYTPTHHDLTNNIFVQVYGSKRFWLIPSMQVPLVYNDNHVYSPVDIRNPDYTKFPKMKNATILQFDVHPGDFLFIPIGWWHAVESLNTSISFSTTAFAGPSNNYFSTYSTGDNRY